MLNNRYLFNGYLRRLVYIFRRESRFNGCKYLLFLFHRHSGILLVQTIVKVVSESAI